MCNIQIDSYFVQGLVQIWSDNEDSTVYTHFNWNYF